MPPTLWQAKIRTDSIAAWVNEWVIHEPTAKTQIGCDRNEWADKDYDPDISTLFGSYSHYCRVSGLQAKGKNNFSSDLIELSQQTLGWGDVNYDRDNQGRRLIRSLRLRTDGDTTPTLEDSLIADNPSDNLKPLQIKKSDNPDNFLTSKLMGIENQLSAVVVNVDEDAKSFDALSINEPELPIESTSQVVSPGCQQVIGGVVSQPDVVSAPPKAPQPAQRELAPVTPTRQPQVFQVGERCRYCGSEGAMAVTCRGKELEVLNTRINDQGEQECEIKASGWCASYWVLSRSLKKLR